MLKALLMQALGGTFSKWRTQASLPRFRHVFLLPYFQLDSSSCLVHDFFGAPASFPVTIDGV
jgi:hypothetical protein